MNTPVLTANILTFLVITLFCLVKVKVEMLLAETLK